MSSKDGTIAVIPARYASTRFPGKPLADLGGKSLIRRVWERVSESGIGEVVIATDDLRIRDEAESFGARVVMTSPDCRSGTDRIIEALSVLGRREIIANVQGDEPFLDTGALSAAVGKVAAAGGPGIASMIERIENPRDLADPNVVKVVHDDEGYALYFSRSPIPCPKDLSARETDAAFTRTVYFKHVGIYVFRYDEIMRFASAPPSSLEEVEGLEQLRILSYGGRIALVESHSTSISIDTPEDLAAAEVALAGVAGGAE